MTQPLPEPPRRGHVYVMPSPVNSSCETPSSVQSDGSRGSSLFVAGDLLNNVQNSISRERNNYARVVQSASINSALLAATGQPGFGLFPVGLTPLAEDKSDPFTCLGPAVHPVAMMRGPLVQAVLSNTPSPATSGLSGLRQVPHVNGLGRSAEDSSQPVLHRKGTDRFMSGPEAIKSNVKPAATPSHQVARVVVTVHCTASAPLAVTEAPKSAARAKKPEQRAPAPSLWTSCFRCF